MGKIEKILKKGSVEGQITEVYPVTSTKAVYDENNKRLDNIITGLQESVYDVVYKNKLTPILQEIDLSGTDADRKAKLDQFAVDWKALTGADTLDGAKFVGYSGEPDNFWGIFIYNSSIEGYSAIAISAQPSTYQVFIFPTGTIISNSLFYHLEPVIIRTGNTDSDMAKNVADIQKYVNNLTYLGVYTYLGFTIPVYLIDNKFCGYLVCNWFKGDRYVLSGTVFFKGIVKSIVIDETGRYKEIVDITGTNPLNTTSDNMVDAINEVNTLAKSKGNGTITEVRMNGVSKGTSGVVDLGTVLTEHQDISGKQDKTDNTLATTDKTVIGAINEINTKVGNLTGALTWKGKLDTLPAVTDYEAGNVIGVDNKEYVLTVTGSTKAWEELGDEGSYLLKSKAEETYAKKTDIPTIPAIPTVNNPKVSIKMNGTEKGSFTLNQASAGEVDLGTVITAHQDISGKVDKTLNAKAFEAITIQITNSAADKAANVAAIKAYVNNLKALGVDIEKGFNVPVRIDTDYDFYGCLTCEYHPELGGYHLSGTIFCVAWGVYYIKAIFITPYGQYLELVNIKNDNDGLSTTSQNLIGAINEVNFLAKEKQDTLTSGTNIKTINGESVLGSGDITITSSGGAYPEVNHGTGDTTFTLTPNTFHVWDEVTSLTLNFGNETNGVANEYLFQFTSGSTATSLTLPDSIKWVNGSAPTIAKNMIYQVSILKGLASVLEFNN